MDNDTRIRYMQDVTGMNDPQECAAILAAHDWDLDAAVSTMLAVNDANGVDVTTSARPSLPGPGNMSGAAPALRSRAGAAASSSAASDVIVDTNMDTRQADTGARPEPSRGITPRHHNQAGIPASFIWKLLAFPLRIAAGGFGFFSGVTRLGFWALTSVLSSSFSSLRNLANWAIGTPTQPRGRLSQPRVSDSQSFIQRLENEYGVNHPRFIDATFAEAVRRGTEQHRFLFVYLHSADHVNTPGFCRGTLCTDVVTAFIDANFVAWGGDVRTSEGFRMSNWLKASRFPYCAVVTGASNQRLLALQQVEGPVSPSRLLAMLQKALDDHGALLVAARADEEERLLSRRLREEQDAAYQAALLEDQEKERRAQEELARLQREADEALRLQQEEEAAATARAAQEAEREAARQRRREEKEASLGVEPPKGPDVTQVLIRLPGGERKERRFPSSARLLSVFDFVDSLGLIRASRYKLISNFPRKVYGPRENEEVSEGSPLMASLVAVGLHPHASLFVQEEEDD
eukprot:TRINITY_DN35906_c0_g1_i1.p1 TRINITY_DN35906_c0_g1~~TRINITY_DN35906_c0_g1_i1.p1  ORF type:complete len:518 (-),score=99.37 TRINITY_DN35906_c0_g1_i1:726-2279(-)